ncbi:hypothetical protein BPJM79_10458 [Bacillus pumilus]
MFISSKEGISVPSPMVKEEYWVYPWDCVLSSDDIGAFKHGVEN